MIVITAPAGLIGHQVLGNVLGSGQPVRVIVRDPSGLPAEARERVEVVQGSHGDIDVVDRAFAGADAVFWLVPPDPHADSAEAAYVDFTRPACDAFKRHGVQRVVGISALGRGTAAAGHAGLVTASLAMDDLIASTGVSYRALTMPSFMDNLLRQVEAIKNQGMFFSPISGDRKLPSCATRDIAAVAARLLLDRLLERARPASRCSARRTCPSTTWRRSCPRCSASRSASSRSPVEAFKARLIGRGMSEAMAQGTVDMMVAKNQGLDNAEPRTPESTTPTSFRQWCEEVLKPAVLA